MIPGNFLYKNDVPVQQLGLRLRYRMSAFRIVDVTYIGLVCWPFAFYELYEYSYLDQDWKGKILIRTAAGCKTISASQCH